MTKRVIFAVGDDELGEGEIPLALVLERQVSNFANAEGIAAFLYHLGDSPWRQIFEHVHKIASGLRILAGPLVCGRVSMMNSKILLPA